MEPDQIAALASIAQVAATIGLAFIVQRSTSRIARLEFSRSLRETWIAIDDLALSDATTLKVADELLSQHTESLAIESRKRWFILAYLNPIATSYQGAREGIYGPDRAEMIAGVTQQLEALLGDDDAYWVTQNHGHEASFQALCREVRSKVLARRTAVVAGKGTP